MNNSTKFYAYFIHLNAYISITQWHVSLSTT
nr:MAG TPA: hypothetical protein [Caudoviricetes sp.]